MWAVLMRRHLLGVRWLGSVWSLRIAQWTRASLFCAVFCRNSFDCCVFPVGRGRFLVVLAPRVWVKLSRAHGGCLGIRSR